MRIARYFAGLTALSFFYFYGLPFLAAIAFRGDGEYHVEYLVPGFHEFRLDLPPVPISTPVNTRFEFSRFYTNNYRSFLSFCIEAPEPIPFWELNSQLRFSFGEKNKAPSVLQFGKMNGDYKRVVEGLQTEREETDWFRQYRYVWEGSRTQTAIPANQETWGKVDLIEEKRACYSFWKGGWQETSWFGTYVVEVQVIDPDDKFTELVAKIELRSQASLK